MILYEEIRGNLPDALLLLLSQSNFAAKARSIKQWILIIYLCYTFIIPS
jgi:hypothetical protein